MYYVLGIRTNVLTEGDHDSVLVIKSLPDMLSPLTAAAYVDRHKAADAAVIKATQDKPPGVQLLLRALYIVDGHRYPVVMDLLGTDFLHVWKEKLHVTN